MANNVVHVIGTGTIGEPLTGLLCDHREDFGISEVVFHKRTPLKTDRSKVLDLVERRGAKLAVDENRVDAFKEMGMEPTYVHTEALEKADVILDCTPVGNKNKEELFGKYLDNTKGFIAQGSEFGFGKMYARGINDNALIPGEDRFLHVVSCNTHNLAVICQTIGFPPEEFDKEKPASLGNTANLDSARFLCLRRANDTSQDANFVPSPQVNAHKDAQFGTHHARDLWHLYKTLNIDLPNVFSSALKVNTQYMHTIHFSLRLKKPTSLKAIRENIWRNDRLAETWKVSVNSVYSFGRDHGHFGRILNQTVFCIPSLHVSNNGKEVTGFCFTPQDGNPLLSTAAATAWYLSPEKYEQQLQCLKPYFFDEV